MNWFALRSTPRGEFRADEELKEVGIERFTPFYRCRTLLKHTKGRVKTVERPLMPGILFARLSDGDFFASKRKRDAFRAVSHGREYLVPQAEEPICKHVVDVYRKLNGTPMVVTDLERLNSLRKLCEAGAFDQGRERGHDNRFVNGDRVRITAGPWAGFVVTFRETASGVHKPRMGYVKVMLDQLFGRPGFDMDVPQELLEAA